MTVNDQNKPDIETVCKELSRAFQGVLTWKWDRRFETVLAEFSVNQKDAICAILERHLSITWDSASIGNAPDIVRTIDDYFGGLRPGQLIFVSNPTRKAVIFCTWWPWGDGKEISIRIGPAYLETSDLERPEKIRQFKIWFGV